ncbi:deoxyribose-phosphate aldolase [Rarobacter faecitabidus]|uniref:Deoxyribose-phosphate aldolase n=1 Tax=Rarobacter faecitabidus TaxID=13243 RepID=A0A542ZUN2_RARFA|nr:deoxyribose-phosphate aldolase [Rarobacter faecitabidus]TQL64068.1 deoxyribose-phosphate aldolase [Rarobacter faecitabidus]
MRATELARFIDHTDLRPEATVADAADAVTLARELGTWGVCVAPSRLERAIEPGATLRYITVCGYPTGAHLAQVKAFEAVRSYRDGAHEIDLVMNLGAAKAGEWGRVSDGIEIVRLALAEAAAEDGQDTPLLKVIVESALLSKDEIVRSCWAAVEAGADLVETSTGTHPAGGASVEAVQIMAGAVGGDIGIKASGGIKDYAFAMALIDAGATRLGTSSTRAVLGGAPN